MSLSLYQKRLVEREKELNDAWEELKLAEARYETARGALQEAINDEYSDPDIPVSDDP